MSRSFGRKHRIGEQGDAPRVQTRLAAALARAQTDVAEDADAQTQTTRRLLADLQSLASRIAAIQEIATSINRCLSLNEILEVVGSQAKWILDYEHCSVYLYEGARPGSRLETLFGPDHVFGSNPAHPAQPIGRVLETGQAQLIHQHPAQAQASDPTSDPHSHSNGLHRGGSHSDSLHRGAPPLSTPPAFEPGATNAELFHSHMILPLESEGEVVGTLNFAQRKIKAYDQEDMRIAYLLALQLAVAIRNLRRFVEIKQLYVEIEGAYAALKTQNQLREDLTNMIVHDLRSPLTVIRLNLELIAGAQEGASRGMGKIIQRTESATERMLGMIDDMLNITKLESDELQLVREIQPFSALLQERAAGYTVRGAQENKTIEIAFAPDLPAVAMDINLMGRVLDNLVGNALKHTPKGGKIEIGGRCTPEHLELYVQDNGSGIAPEHQKLIFEKFGQVKDSKGKPLREGTGLGLAFCRMVTEAHGGAIRVESEIGCGSTFVVALPISASL